MTVITDGIVKRFKQIGVDEKTASIFADNMIANYWFVLLNAVPKGILGQEAIEHLKKMNLPFEMSYRSALKNRG